MAVCMACDENCHKEQYVHWKIGQGEIKVSAMGLGCWAALGGMSAVAFGPLSAEQLATVERLNQARAKQR